MDMIERIDALIEKFTALKSVLGRIEFPEEMSVYLSPWTSKAIIEIRNLDDLEKARHLLRGQLGSWTDSISNIWALGSRGCASYESPDYPIEIRLHMPVNEFPKKIMGQTCRFVAETETQTTYRYVCENH